MLRSLFRSLFSIVIQLWLILFSHKRITLLPHLFVEKQLRRIQCSEAVKCCKRSKPAIFLFKSLWLIPGDKIVAFQTSFNSFIVSSYYKVLCLDDFSTKKIKNSELIILFIQNKRVLFPFFCYWGAS